MVVLFFGNYGKFAIFYSELVLLAAILTTSIHGQGSTKKASEERGPNREADQLVSYKRSQGVELGSTAGEIPRFQLVVRTELKPPTLGFQVQRPLINQPCCVLNSNYKRSKVFAFPVLQESSDSCSPIKTTNGNHERSRVSMIIIHSKYFPVSDWSKPHA